MTRKQRHLLTRIIVAAVLFLALMLRQIAQLRSLARHWLFPNPLDLNSCSML